MAGFFPNWLLRAIYDSTKPFQGKLFILVRFLCVRNLFGRCGENVFISSHVELRFFRNIRVGNDVSIQNGAYLDARGNITIGNDVSISHGVSLVAFDHGYTDYSLPIRKNKYVNVPISIENDVWIGAGARILAGSRLGSRVIVAANSVVTKNTTRTDHVLLGGIPANILKRI